MNKIMGFFAALFLIGSLAYGAGLLPELEFVGTPGTPINTNYNVSSEVTLQQDIAFQHRGLSADFFLTVNEGLNSGGNPLNRQALGPDGTTIAYSVTTLGGTVFTGVNGYTGSFPTLTGGAWQQRTEGIEIILTGGQFPRAGTYTDNLQIQLYRGTDNTGVLEDTGDLPVSIVMDEIVDMRLVQPGGTYETGILNFVINYPTLLPGMSETVELLVRTNVPYSVEFISQNGGNLENLGDGSLLPYIMEVDGSPVSFVGTNPTQVISNGLPSDITGTPYLIETSIPDTGTLPSQGDYQDVISITVIAN